MKHTDRSFNNFECRAIADEYLTQNRSAKTITRLLNRGGPYGRYLAGEVAIEDAYRIRNQGGPRFDVQKSLEHARRFLALVPEYNDVASLKARARLAQLPLLKSILGAGQLPSSRNTKIAYSGLLLIGRDALITPTVAQKESRTSNNANQLLGIASEIAALTLAQRFTLRNGTAREWLPVDSSLSQDHGGSCTSSAKRFTPWDTTIFTQYDDSTAPSETYKIQIKSGRSTELQSPENQEISEVKTLRINPDLWTACDRSALGVVSSIINTSIYELENPVASLDRVTPMLDQRTEQLLNVIDP